MATNLNALVMRISADTSGLSAGVKLTRSEIGRLNSIQRQAKDNADRLRESTAVLQKAHAAGAIDAQQLTKAVESVTARYGSNTKATNDNAEAIKRAQAMVKQTVPEVEKLKSQFRDLMVAERAGSITSQEYARAKQVLIDRTKQVKAAMHAESEAGKRAAAAARGHAEHVRQLREEQDRATSSTVGFASRLKTLIAAYAGFRAIRAAGGVVIELEQATVAMEVFTGSAEQGAAMIQDLRELAAATPLSFSGSAKAAKTLMSYNIAAEEVIPTLRNLGDISGGNAEAFQSFALAIGQVKAAGRLMGQELNQMNNAGFNPLQEMVRTTGKSFSQLKQEMADGKISYADVQKAMESATGAGGRFAGMMEKYAKTTGGSLALMRSEAEGLASDIGAVVSPMIAKFARGTRDALVYVRDFLSNMTRLRGSMIASVGAFSAAVIIIPKMVAGVVAVTKAVRAMITAQITLTALSGPKGWAIIAGGLLAASTAVYAVDKAFDSYNEKLAQNQQAQSQLADAAKNTASVIISTNEQIYAAEAERQRPAREYIEALREQNLELTMGVQWVREYNALQGSTAEQRKELEELKQRNQWLKDAAQLEANRNKVVADRIKKRKEEVAAIVKAGEAYQSEMVNPIKRLAKDLADIDAARYRGEISDAQALASRSAKEQAFRGDNAQPIKVELPPSVQRGSREEYQAITSIFTANRAREEARHRESIQVAKANEMATIEVSNAIRELSTTEAV